LIRDSAFNRNCAALSGITGHPTACFAPHVLPVEERLKLWIPTAATCKTARLWQLLACIAALGGGCLRTRVPHSLPPLLASPPGLPSCLLAHIHLGKRGAQCIAGDRSGQWVAIARCAPEFTVHVSCQRRDSKPPCPPTPAPNRSFCLSLFPSFPFPSPEVRLDHLAVGAGTTRHDTMSQSHRLSRATADRRQPLSYPDCWPKSKSKSTSTSKSTSKSTPAPCSSRNPPRQLCSRRDYGTHTLCRARLSSAPSPPPLPRPSTLAAWASDDVPGVSARGGPVPVPSRCRGS
jgi:hypothetical protein